MGILHQVFSVLVVKAKTPGNFIQGRVIPPDQDLENSGITENNLLDDLSITVQPSIFRNGFHGHNDNRATRVDKGYKIYQ